MPRPKVIPGQPSAADRLEAAYWELLTERPYRDIAVGVLSKRARVNHNTFYYYFDNLTSMTETMVARTLSPELPRFLVSAMTTEDLDITKPWEYPWFQAAFQRLCLLVGPHGEPWIAQRIKDAVLTIWLESFDIDFRTLNRRDYLIATFAIGGMLAILGELGAAGTPEDYRLLAESDLGQTMRATVLRLMHTKDATAAAITAPDDDVVRQ